MIRAKIGNVVIFERKPIRVTVWNEYIHERSKPEVAKIYPKGIHNTVAEGLQPYGFLIRTATLEQPENGLTENVLNQTDILIWWSHIANEQVSDEVVNRIYERVLQGMGLIVLHSGFLSKIFKKLMGTSCLQKWREEGETERLWVVAPSHPITEGIGQYIELDREEMYGEYFDIPAPDDLIFIGWFKGGEVFRSGCTFYRGLGKIFFSSRDMKRSRHTRIRKL